MRERLHVIVPLVVVAVVFAYIAIAVLPGPRRAVTGLEPQILAGIGAAVIVVGLCRPRRWPYLIGALVVAGAFASASLGPVAPWTPTGQVFASLFALGWVLIVAAVRNWRAGVASYLAAGVWTTCLLAVPEGPAYFAGPLRDVDQLFWEVLFPLGFWPYVTFAMLGVFGVRLV